MRIIGRLDIKGANVIKGIQFECLRVIGLPLDIAENYYLQGADEIIYIDTVASLYERSLIIDIVKKTSSKIHIPLIAGGGVRKIKDIENLLNAGADKVAINTAAIKKPLLLSEAAKKFGSQCIVSSIQAKKIGNKKWEVYIDSGREKTSIDVVSWAKKVQRLGVGEILLTSVDRDGTESGLDEELIDEVSKITKVSLVVSGGVSSPNDYIKCSSNFKVDGIAAGTIFHYNKFRFDEIKKLLVKKNNKLNIRSIKIDSRLKSKKIINIKNNYNQYTLNQIKSEKLKVKKILISRNIIHANKKFDVGIINFGINNLQSIKNATDKISTKSSWIQTPEDVMKSKVLILPGVGAFKHGMKGLRERKLIDAIKYKASIGTPLLGICLGMQLLFTESEENGIFKGLNLIPGTVKKLKNTNSRLKIPHMGWNKINLEKKILKNPIFKKIKSKESYFYFIHSFFAKPDNKDHVVATTNYGENKFCSIVQNNNIFGFQFHPEKSASPGLDLIKFFLYKFVNKN